MVRNGTWAFPVPYNGAFAVSELIEESRQDRIADIVTRLLEQRMKAKRPGRDDDLRQAGLSSLDMVKVVLSLEQQFSVSIPEQAITPKHFRTIAAIDAMLENLPKAL